MVSRTRSPEAGDGRKGLPEAITITGQPTVAQQCVVHLIRNSFRYASRRHRDGIVTALKPVDTASSEAAAADRFPSGRGRVGPRYPAIAQRWGLLSVSSCPSKEDDVEIHLRDPHTLRGILKRLERSATTSDDVAAPQLQEEPERLTGVICPAAG